MVIILLLYGAFWTGCQNSDQLPDQVDYNFHVRPILSNNCYTCHGPDPSSREADLRLDIFEGATAENEDGQAAIVPGNPGKSLLLQKVASHDPDEMMPPPEAKKVLSETEIALLEKWIKQGAKWKEHWAFIPPQKYNVPRSGSSSQVNNEIDRFILQKLKQQKIKPNEQADKHQLIRRLSYSLTGLPPSIEDVEAFLEDDSPEAYEKLVDRLLASPHFGEKWARHWMDLVRYAETKGHEFDYGIGGAWHYRDYLIRAFNSDLPYDQLIKEHLAGDMLEHPRLHPTESFNESIIGTAYFNMCEGKHSPVDTKAEEMDIIDNAIDVTSKSFQALTVGCAKCHDHKFDPIPTKDYYALYGIFESSRLGPIPTKTTPQTLKSLEEIKAIKGSIRQQIADRFAQEKDFMANLVEVDQTSTIHRVSDISANKDSSDDITVFEDFRDGEWGNWYSHGLAFGNKPVSGELILDEERKSVVGLAGTRISSKSVGKGVQGVLRSPNFEIPTDKITVRAAGKNSSVRLIMNNFQMIQNPIYGELDKTVDGEEMKHYTMEVSMWRGRSAYLEIIPGKYTRHVYAINPDEYIEAEYVLFHNEELPEDFLVPLNDQGFENSLEAWKNGELANNYIEKIDAYLQSRPLAIPAQTIETWEKLQQKSSELYDPTHIMGLQEGDPVYSHVFIRGDFNQLSEEPVERIFMRGIENIQAEITNEGSGRLDLAEAIASENNPLTSRVMVNRIWHHLFGRGIVETVDNFGVQGKLPSHPELLDFLALKFVEYDWSIKKMIKFILMSQTFQRSTHIGEEAAQKDPQNLYLSHFPVKRIEAEAIRDAMLSVSGCLDLTLFGPSVPIHLTEFMKGRGRPGRSGPLDGDGRRSIYTSVRRNFLSPMMLAFDMPIPFTTFGKRNVSNVPAQSLTLMNDPFVGDQALMWARNLLSKVESMDERLERIYIQAFSRPPSKQELDEARAFLLEQGEIYELSDAEVLQDYRPWLDFCHAVMNMKEFIFLM